MKFNCENQNVKQNDIGKMFKILRLFSLFLMIIFSIFLIHSTVVKTEFNKKCLDIKIPKDRRTHLNNPIKDFVNTKDKLIRKITPKLKSNEDFEDVQLKKIIFNEEEIVLPVSDKIYQLIEELEADKLIISTLNVFNKEEEFFDI